MPSFCGRHDGVTISTSSVAASDWVGIGAPCEATTHFERRVLVTFLGCRRIDESEDDIFLSGHRPMLKKAWYMTI